MIRVCIICSKSFYIRPSRVGGNKGATCSTLCNGLRTRKRVSVECAQCFKKFEKTLSKLSGSKSKKYFCSRICKDKAQRLDGIVEIHPPHFGTGKSSYREIAFRHYPKRCNRCGWSEVPAVLQVHHRDRNRDNNKFENLEVLCPNHHMIDHFKNHDGLWTKSGTVA